MPDFTGSVYTESAAGDIPNADVPVYIFGVNTQLSGNVGLNDVDQPRFDVRQAGASTYHVRAPAPGSSLQFSLNAPGVSYFDFYIFDASSRELFHRAYNGTGNGATTNFAVDASVLLPDTDFVYFSMNGFRLAGASATFSPVAYTLTVNGTPAQDPNGPSTVTLTGPGSVTEGNVGAANKLTFTLTRTGNTQRIEDIDWTFTGVEGRGANPLDFRAIADLPTSGTVRFAPGETVKLVEFPILGDAQPELTDRFRLSISSRDVRTQLPTASVEAAIFNDDGVRNVDTLLFWAFNKNRTAFTSDNDLPGFAHSALNAERNYDSDDFALLLASRYAWGVEDGIGNRVQGSATYFLQYLQDPAKLGMKLLTELGRPELENYFSTGDQRPSWPSLTANQAYGRGIFDGWITGAWKQDYVSPSPPSGEISPARSMAQAAASPPTTIYVRSDQSGTSTHTIDGVTYTLVKGPTVPVSGTGVFVFDTINDAVLRTGSGDDQIISSRERAYIESGEGNDLVVVRDSGSLVLLGGGDDVFLGGEGLDQVTAGAGNDLLLLGGGADVANGGTGSDQVDGGAGRDTFVMDIASSAATITRAGRTTYVDVGGDRDTLTGVERIQFTDRMVLLQEPGFDLNGDGFGDVLWQHAGGQASVWTTNGSAVTGGLFTGGNPGPSWHLISAGDFSGDGQTDFLWQNDSGQASVWIMNGTSLASGALLGANPGASWQVKDTGDFDGDGIADVLWQHDSGVAAVWITDNGAFESGAVAGANPGPTWKVKAAADFNGDGKSDILWQNDNGTAAVWLMDGTRQIGGAVAGASNGASWHVIDAADFNGDGKADILWQHDSGQAAIWLMDGTQLVSGALAGANPGSAWQAQRAVDFNGDSKADILWQNTNGTAALWTVDGLNITGGAVLGNPGTDWHVV